MATALTIAGSDSGGGAGIQADLKTFAAHGVYGTSAITALTAQNTVGVQGVHVVPDDFVTAQIEAVAADLGCDAVKTGMLANATIVEAVAAAVEALELPNLVVDPVMVAKSGDHLLDEEAVHAMRWTLLRLARVVTPNIPEAEVLAKMSIKSLADMREAARRIAMLKPAAVVIKGGHMAGPEVVDLLLEDGEYHEWVGPRIEGPNTHGTGCTFASAIAAHLAKGASLIEAVPAAKAYVEGAMRHGIALGKGHRPLDHFWNVRRSG
jgi:hydroxymethylpyrimidine/phosphomethylpyrimidine kinase